MISNIDNILNYVELSIGMDDDLLVKPNIEEKEEFSVEEVLDKEKQVFGFYLTSHRTEKYKLNNKNIMDIYDINNNLNKKVEVIVSIDKIKEILTKKNEAMCFLTSSDNTGSTVLIVFPDLYKNYNNFKKGDIIKVKGKVEKRFDEYQIICNEIEEIVD